MTVSTDHVWVKHVITPVSVLDDDEQLPVVFVDPDHQTQAEDDAVYGCQICGEAMATHYNTECAGDIDGQD